MRDRRPDCAPNADIDRQSPPQKPELRSILQNGLRALTSARIDHLKKPLSCEASFLKRAFTTSRSQSCAMNPPRAKLFFTPVQSKVQSILPTTISPNWCSYLHLYCYLYCYLYYYLYEYLCCYLCCCWCCHLYCYLHMLALVLVLLLLITYVCTCTVLPRVPILVLVLVLASMLE